MDLKQYIMPLLRWWWLLVAATLVAAGASYNAVRQQSPIYQAHATLMIGRMIQDPNPNSGEFYLVQQLAAAYADIGNREPVKYKTMEALGISYLPATRVSALPNSSLIAISVTDTDPKRAQVVANELANQLILTSPTSSNSEDRTRQQFVNDQLDKLQSQIQETNAEIEKLQQQLGDLNSARQIADMQTQITAQQQKLTTLQANYASLLGTTQSGATNTLSLIEPAGLPITPIGPNKLMTVALASAIGLALSSLAAYVIEALDDSLKSTEEINRLIKAPILGYIGEIPQNNRMTYVVEEPRSPVSDAFRLLRTNLEFLGIKNPLQVILITSPDVEDGKSIIASNLAASIAQSPNKRVILIDADLRKPTLHTGLAVVENRNGLSEICLGTVNIQDAMISWGYGELKFIPAGVVPPNPVELLSSDKFSQAIDEMKAYADVIIIDSPPIFLADTLVLSGKVDGVLIVLRPGYTRKKSVVRMLDHFQKTGVNLTGVVLNRVAKSESYYSGYYRSQPDKNKVFLSRESEDEFFPPDERKMDSKEATTKTH
jgi:capsular exopolysaccharide synthesis family protein